MSLPEKEVLKTKICCYCKKTKSIDSFHRNASMKNGYNNKCKLCKKAGLFCVKVKDKRTKPKDTSLMMLQVKKKDWIETYEFLKRIGYDLNKNIHEQFCERNNLKPRKRMFERTRQYTPQDLGMI